MKIEDLELNKRQFLKNLFKTFQLTLPEAKFFGYLNALVINQIIILNSFYVLCLKSLFANILSVIHDYNNYTFLIVNLHKQKYNLYSRFQLQTII